MIDDKFAWIKDLLKQLKSPFICAILLSTGLLISFNASAKEDREFFPAALLQMDDNYSHHILIAEKSTHTLYLFENLGGYPRLVKNYQMVTGKMAGNKKSQGDFRTPEGIYYFVDFIPKSDLLERYGKDGDIYGVGAFVMDFPNPIDRGLGKTGGGIWLHSTNDETRIEKGLDSRGCIVAANNDLKDISQYLELNRSEVIIVHDLEYWSKETWEKARTDLHNTLMGWSEAWRSENFDEYIKYYHPQEFSDVHRGNFSEFANYKKAVFKNKGTPQINVSDVSILYSKGYATISFTQDYSAEKLKDVGRKILYLKKDEYYKWKIVAEIWTKSGLVQDLDHRIAFRPSMRFFNDPEEKKGSN